MNDFTKEELEDLYAAIRYCWKHRAHIDLPSDSDDCTNSYELMEKVQTMIDNYEKDRQVKEFLNYIVMKAREWGVEL